MKLFFRKLGEAEHSLVILHGIFGSSDNWHTLAKGLAENYTVYLVDARNHGQSPHSEDFSYQLMAEDLAELIQNENIQNYTLIGHSMGGKTAMLYADQLADDMLKNLVVVDMGIKSYPMHHDKILAGLTAIDAEKLSSRKEAEEIMDQYVPEFTVKQFLLKNLYRKKDGSGYAWRINVPVLNNTINNIIEEINLDKIEVPTLFMRGGKSTYILKEDFPSLREKFTNAEFKTIEKSGHWIHAEAPDEFYKVLNKFIEQQQASFL